MQNNERKIVTGNFFDSRFNGNRFINNSITVGSDYRIVEPDGTVYFYRYRFSSSEEITELIPTTIQPESKIAWEELPLPIRKKHFNMLFPNDDIDENEKIMFIYGEKEGQKIIDDKWADAHIVINKEITLKLMKELGKFDSVRLLRSSLVSNDQIFVYLLDEKWQVTIHLSRNSFSYQVEDYSSSVAKNKASRQRIKNLCKQAHLPCEIGVLVGHIDSDKEALKLLNKIKSSRKLVTKSDHEELLSGSMRRMRNALKTILGNTTWNKLGLKSGSRKKIVTLASYLAGITD